MVVLGAPSGSGMAEPQWLEKLAAELGLGDSVHFVAPVAVPADGVYAGWLIRADGTRLPAAISIGTNPTFDGTERRVEAYALDVDVDLYGEHVSLDFVERLRATERYTTSEALVKQIARDVERTRELLSSADDGAPGPNGPSAG